MSKENTLTVQLTVAEARLLMDAGNLAIVNEALDDLPRKDLRALSRGIDKLHQKVKAWERKRVETGVGA